MVALAAISSSPVAGAASLSINDTSDHIISGTEPTTVWTVTFAGASNHQAVVDLGGDGTHLSERTNGTITSSLSATSGHATTSTGNAVLLNTDSVLRPSLSVNAANPAGVIFTVSGLESDYSGTVTFTDTTSKSDVVPIGSDGTYSANLSNLTNGTLTYVMTVTNPAGNVVTVDPTATLGDGSANAPAGTPQLPNLLNGYAVRPPWEVAGVDYAVGVPSGTVLKNPSTISMPGVSVNTSTHTIGITGNNVTLNGYDFSLNGGWAVLITGGATNTVIENSNFVLGSNNNVPIQSDTSASNLTVIDDVFNGASESSSSAPSYMIYYQGSGTFVSEYNLFENLPSDAIDFGTNSLTATVEFNVFDNLGLQSGAHPDTVQLGGGATTTNLVIAYNTIYQPATQTEGMEGIQIAAWNGGSATNTTITNNTLIAPVGAATGNTMSYVMALLGSSGNPITDTVIEDNYIDPTGAYGTFYPLTYSGGPTNTTISNNVDMTTGNFVQANNSKVHQPR